MEKTNKITVFYVISSVTLFLVLLLGGVYGVYVSVGLNFVRSNTPVGDYGGENGIANVSFGGNVNYSPSMVGVIFLSIILVVISIFDFFTLIKQVIFFKQFKAVNNSSLTKKIEAKTPSKGGVIFWTFIVDILSFIAGVAGLFINNRSFAGGNEMSWLFYLIDSVVALLSLLSIILLIVKLKNKATEKKNSNVKKDKLALGADERKTRTRAKKESLDTKDFSQMEYNLMKLDSMKKAKIVTEEEYKKIRKKILNFDFSKNALSDYKKDW